MKLLIVEDSVELLKDMREFLISSGFVVETASTILDAQDKIDVYQYDVIILDLGLPDGNGLQIIKDIKRENEAAGILIVTAKDALEDKVKGLEMGADDYVTKPFHQAELLARVRSIIRRRYSGGASRVEVGKLSADINSYQIFAGENELDLTRKEFDLLLYLMHNRNRTLTRENIAEHLWGDDIDQADSFDFIYNHVKNVRKKIDKAGGGNPIKSVYGIGYRLVEDENF